MEKLRKFPSVPSYTAKWYPLLFSHIEGSEEALTLAICIKGSDGQSAVKSTIEASRFKHLFGGRAKAIHEMTSICLQSAKNALKDNIDIGSWTPPIAGFRIGEERAARGRNIEDVLFQAASMSTAIGYHLIDLEREAEEDLRIAQRTDKWIKSVRDVVKLSVPALANNFNKKIKLTESGSPLEQKFDFFTPGYAAQFSVFNPGSVSLNAAIRGAQARLWRLDRVRDIKDFKKINIELIAGHPNFDAGLMADDEVEQIKNAMEEVKEEASKREISLFEANNPTFASQHLISCVIKSSAQNVLPVDGHSALEA